MISCFKKCFTCIGKEQYIKKNINLEKEIEVTNVISNKTKDDKKCLNKNNLKSEICTKDPTLINGKNDNCKYEKKNSVELIISKKSEVVNIAVEKTVSSEIKKDKSPPVEKTVSSEIKKDKSPPIEKTVSSEIKKDNLSEIKGLDKNNSKNSKNSKKCKSPILVKTEKESDVKKVVIDLKDNEWCKVDYI